MRDSLGLGYSSVLWLLLKLTSSCKIASFNASLISVGGVSFGLRRSFRSKSRAFVMARSSSVGS